MDEVSVPQIAEIFLHNKEEAENYLSQYGNTSKDKNNGVSLSYEHIAKADPLFLWFSAATIGSIQVGKVIDLGNNPILSHCESTNTLSLGFSYGNQQIHNNVVALYNTYKDYGIDGLKSLDADQLTMSIADSSNHNDLGENYALTWDDTTHQWRMVTDSDVSTHLGGIWVSPDTYPEVMNVVEKFPLIENTFYYDTTSNQSYLFCSVSFLPNLPPNYTWTALKTYLQPVVSSYENRGSIWVPIENITTSTMADTREANNGPNKLVLAEILDLFDDSLGRFIESLPIHKAQQVQSGDELDPTTSLAFSDVVASSIIPMPELISEIVRSEFC